MSDNSYPIVGIDLGTTFSAIATINPAGKPEIVPNYEGERLTASAVYFAKGGQVVVGQLAVDASAAEPNRVVQWVKREIGNPSWFAEIDGKRFSAVDISALVLKKLKQDAEKVLGTVRYVVITVPAYFDEAHRKATMDAAEQAGFEVLRIINEPTAAALAHTAHKEYNGKVLVFDFGGGTFDVSIVDVRSRDDISVVCSEGDHRLGGHDLDKALLSFMDRQFMDASGNHLYDSEHDPQFHLGITLAESIKKFLSRADQRNGILLSNRGMSHSLDITRDAFEQVISKYVARIEMLVEDAVAQAGISPQEIDEVVLVGGSSRIPAIQSMLRAKFGKEPQAHVNVDEAVALGAALQAALIMNEKGLVAPNAPELSGLSKTRLADVTNHSYGTIAVADMAGRQTLRNTILISKNSAIPCSVSKSFYKMHPNQTEIKCTLTQGEDEDPDFVKVVMEELMALPTTASTNYEVRVTYSYDANERMACEFLDVATGTKKVLTLDTIPRAGRAASIETIDADSFNALDIT